jgi:hypothetical protein
MLFICVILFTQSYHNLWLKNNIRILILVCGAFPGAIGIILGVWHFVQSFESLPFNSFVLLEMGATSLLSLTNNEKRT